MASLFPAPGAALRIYSLACPVRADAQGNRVAGCGRGWTSDNRTESCPGCGEVGQVRGVWAVTDLKRPVVK